MPLFVDSYMLISFPFYLRPIRVSCECRYHVTYFIRIITYLETIEIVGDDDFASFILCVFFCFDSSSSLIVVVVAAVFFAKFCAPLLILLVFTSNDRENKHSDCETTVEHTIAQSY